jgi:hypothetical protein
MQLSQDAKRVAGVTILIIPTIMYGGWTLLGILSHGAAGATPNGLLLNESQRALWRAGHAHAGVWTILSLILQVLLDSARLGSTTKWVARISAPLSAVLLSAGFFGLAFLPSFRWLLYCGALAMILALVITAIGLLRNARDATDTIESP